jgi:5-methylcytosine-specific restriction endonuclease McrA
MKKKRRPHSEETKKKIGAANRISLLGNKLTEAHKRKLSIGSPKFWLGKKLSEDHRKKLSEAHKGEKSIFWRGGISKDVEYQKFRNRQKSHRRYHNHGFHTYHEWETLKAQYNWTCPWCHEKEPEIKLTEDHIIPLIKGGSDNIENIQPLCKKCNSKKGVKIIKFI